MSADDPIGVLNDILNHCRNLLAHLPLLSSDQTGRNTRETLTQLQESTALLATAQLILRHRELGDISVDEQMDMDSGTKGRKMSLNVPGVNSREFNLLRELGSDLRPLMGYADQGFLRWVGKMADKHLGLGLE